MSINELMLSAGPNIYYDDSFRNVLEDHLWYLKNHASTNVLSIEPIKAYKYEYDLYGLLNSYSINMNLHWIIMRLNNMTDPTEVTRDLKMLLIPDIRVIEQIRQSHMTTRRIA